MDVLIVTGMSGAGKSKSLKILEDLGYLCMDNIMPQLLLNILETCDRNKESMAVNKLAVSIDVRGGVFFRGIFDALNELHAKGFRARVLFLDATDEVLVNRYKESRREHPLSVGSRVVVGIAKEREVLESLKDRADIYIDTSYLSSNDLSQKLFDVLPDRGKSSPSVIVVTFGLKRGIPMDCDMVYDVRFLPNPFHDPSLRQFNGLNKEVVDYIYSDPLAKTFVESIVAQIDSILPVYVSNVKTTLVVGVGCTGGKHRSVAVAEQLMSLLTEKGIKTSIEHRDLYKE